MDPTDTGSHNPVPGTSKVHYLNIYSNLCFYFNICEVWNIKTVVYSVYRAIEF